MTQERTETLLVREATEQIKRFRDEIQSVEEAKARTGELVEKINALLKNDRPDPKNESDTSLYDKVDSDNWMNRVRRDVGKLKYFPDEGYGYKEVFIVPSDQEEVEVTVSNRFEGGGYAVIVNGLESLLRINYHGDALIVSVAHNYRPFDMHTRIGPNSNGDLGPKWSRGMNMTDFENYSALLDRLTEPDVIRAANSPED